MRADPEDEVLTTMVTPVITESPTLLPITVEKDASSSNSLTWAPLQRCLEKLAIVTQIFFANKISFKTTYGYLNIAWSTNPSSVTTANSTFTCQHKTAQKRYDDIGKQIREAW